MTPPPTSAETLFEEQGGIVLFCDIIDFSELPPERQTEAVRTLWSWLQSDLSSNPDGDPVELHGIRFNGTGDGFLMCVFQRPKYLKPRWLVDFASRLVASLKTIKLKLRVGIHMGQMIAIQVAERTELVGSAINQCARIVPFAAPGEIVITEQFLHHWEQNEPDLPNIVTPPMGVPPIGIFVKHERELGIRRYDGDTKTPRSPSRKMEALEGIIYLIWKTLADIEEQVCAALAQIDGTLTPEVLDARVSILSPRNVGGQRRLCSNIFRYRRNGKRDRPGRTSYGIQGPRPEGPAKCMISRRPSILRGLPIYNKDRKAYIDMVRREWDLKQSHFTHWTCEARSFITFPFGMFDFSNAEPEGVVCIDMLNSLEKLDSGELLSIAAFLQEYGYSRLAPLWRLRTSP